MCCLAGNVVKENSHCEKANTIAAELGHVVNAGCQHDHRAMLAQRSLGDHRVNRVLVPMQ
jgi:hypothetical protein